MLSFVVTMAPSYSAPAVVGRAARAAVSMNVADLPGAGEETLGKVFDPLGLSDMQPYGSANQEWMRTAEVRARSARARPRAAPARQQLRRRSAAQRRTHPPAPPLPQIKHGRICMIASIGYLMSQAHVTFPGMLSTSEGKAFADLPSDALGAWAAVPEAGKMQIFAVAGLIEIANEVKKPHYMKAGMPTFDRSTRKGRGRMAELKNGRLAMIAVAAMFAETKVPGSVPLLPW